MAVRKFSFPYQVSFSDCDPADMAYYPRIIEWLDWAGENMWREAGHPWHDFFNKDGMRGMPMLEFNVAFSHPMRFGDTLAITTWIEAFEGRSFVCRHEIHNGDILCASATERRAWVVDAPESPKKIKAAPFPEELRPIFHPPD